MGFGALRSWLLLLRRLLQYGHYTNPNLIWLVATTPSIAYGCPQCIAKLKYYGRECFNANGQKPTIHFNTSWLTITSYRLYRSLISLQLPGATSTMIEMSQIRQVQIKDIHQNLLRYQSSAIHGVTRHTLQALYLASAQI